MVDSWPTGAKRSLQSAGVAAVGRARRPRSGKRRRMVDGEGAAAGAGMDTAAVHPGAVEPLRGLVVAVTAASEQAPRDGPASPAEPHYQEIAQLCRTAGATVVRQVHKRVHCVVATQSATDAATQRIRKARSKGIPVVQVLWILDCRKAGRLLAFDDYRLEEEPSQPQQESGYEEETCGSDSGQRHEEI